MHYSSSLLLNRTVAGARRTTHLLAAALTPLSLALAGRSTVARLLRH